MVTKKQLEKYRSGIREVQELRSLMREAERTAERRERAEDKKRALYEAARYDALADERADELERIDMEIDALPDADQRRVIRMRYVEGMSRAATARRMERSLESVDKYTAAAIRELEKE